MSTGGLSQNPANSQALQPITPTDVSIPATPTPVATTVASTPTAEEVATAKWDALCDFLNKWFYKPDLQALAITLATCAAQYELAADPVWLFIIGPAGSGKTAICIGCASALSSTQIMGDITPRTFLSGYTGKKHPSLLIQLGNGILLFKDFTTFLAKRQDDRSQIASQLREIYDGSFVKHTGMTDPIAWQGKMTVIAAATHALEKYWALQREFGERFVSVRWDRKSGEDALTLSEYAAKQLGYEKQIQKGMKERCSNFFMGKNIPPIHYPPPNLTPVQTDMVAAMSEFVCLGRTQVSRDMTNNNRITDIPHPEESSRISKALSSIIRYHAAMFRRSTVTNVDMVAGARVALDSIPLVKCRLILAMPKDGGVLAPDTLQQHCGVNRHTLEWHMEELEALNVVSIDKSEQFGTSYSLTAVMRKLWARGFEKVAALLT